MPGLLDNFPSPGGILGGLGGMMQNMAGSISPSLQENNYRRQAYQALAQQGDPGTAALLMANPQAYQMNLQQRIMQQTYQSLIQKGVPEPNARLLAMNPALMGELAKPQALQAGGSLAAPLDLLGGGGTQAATPQQPGLPGQVQSSPLPPIGGAPQEPGLPGIPPQPGQSPQPQQQPGSTGIQPQQPGLQPPQMPQSQPAQPGGGLSIQNHNGEVSDTDAEMMAHQYVLGNQDILNQFGRSGTGLGAVNRQKVLKFVQQIMKQGIQDPATGQMRPMTYSDIAANQMKYKGLSGTINDIYKTNNALNTGIGHMGEIVDAFQNLNNGNFKPSNYVKNLFGDVFGKASPVVYQAVLSRVAPEIMRIWRGSGGTGEEIQQDKETLSGSNSPEQGIGALAAIARMMGNKAETNQYQFENVFGPHTGDFMIAPQNRDLLKRFQTMVQPQQAGATSQATSRAVEYLKAHPETRGDFERKFGPGSAQKVLGDAKYL